MQNFIHCPTKPRFTTPHQLRSYTLLGLNDAQMNTRHSFFVQNYFIYIHTFLDFFPPRLKNSFYLFFYHNSLKIHFNFRKKYLHTLVHISFALLQCLCCCWHLHIALIRKNANAYKVRKRLHASSVARTLTDFYTHTNIHTPYMNNVQKFYISLCVYVCIKSKPQAQLLLQKPICSCPFNRQNA